MRVLDTEIDIATNRWLLFGRYQLLFLLLIYSALGDAISTTYFMARIGPSHETNVAVRLLAYNCGIVWGPLLGKCCKSPASGSSPSSPPTSPACSARSSSRSISTPLT